MLVSLILLLLTLYDAAAIVAGVNAADCVGSVDADVAIDADADVDETGAGDRGVVAAAAVADEPTTFERRHWLPSMWILQRVPPAGSDGNRYSSMNGACNQSGR